MTGLARFLASTVAAAVMFAGCDRKSGHAESDQHDHGAETSPAPTNRVDIPEAVRRNLGITFARVEHRAVSHTLRIPGRFEHVPTARREYRTPVGGTVELLVSQYQSVEAGTPLYSVASPAWRDLHERIAAMRARVDSMGPLREAHRVHERSLADKVRLWEERLAQLAELRAAGGGSAGQFTEARAALNATQAELADVMEKDAELHAQQKAAESELRALIAQRRMLVNMTGRHDGSEGSEPPPGADGDFPFVVHAVAPGVVEALGITAGGLAEESSLIVTVVQPDQVRFRARALQADLGRLRDGLPAAVVRPQDDGASLQEAIEGTLQLGLTADAEERTVDLLMMPAAPTHWARAGVAAYLEVTLAGGRTELAVPASAVARDGLKHIIFRRDPADPDKAIRMEADLGLSDGRWVEIKSGVKEGDEVVLDGVYQLMLATSGSAGKGGHFHPDGTFHEGDH